MGGGEYGVVAFVGVLDDDRRLVDEIGVVAGSAGIVSTPAPPLRMLLPALP